MYNIALISCMMQSKLWISEVAAHVVWWLLLIVQACIIDHNFLVKQNVNAKSNKIITIQPLTFAW